MSDAAKTPVAARPASTVVILRDGAESIEVFMVVRHHQIDFASGALVFPGGKVDKEDSDAAWSGLATQPPANPDRSFFIAAGRETFEEAGLMLARRRGTNEMIDADAAPKTTQHFSICPLHLSIAPWVSNGGIADLVSNS
jgi:8-oxo-dGTP pyrophosphatase MutT (NUDIX family)